MNLLKNEERKSEEAKKKMKRRKKRQRQNYEYPFFQGKENGAKKKVQY